MIKYIYYWLFRQEDSEIVPKTEITRNLQTQIYLVTNSKVYN